GAEGWPTPESSSDVATTLRKIAARLVEDGVETPAGEPYTPVVGVPAGPPPTVVVGDRRSEPMPGVGPISQVQGQIPGMSGLAHLIGQLPKLPRALEPF